MPIYFAAVLLLTACAAGPQSRSSEPPPVKTESVVEAERPQPERDDVSDSPPPEPKRFELPAECADPNAAVCTPPPAFVEELCRRASSRLPLVLFKKGTPWARGYVRVSSEAWYAGGGPASPERMSVGEEVLILAARTGGSSGVQIVGSGSYDVLRWNGSCVSLMSDEVSKRPLGMLNVAPILWHRLPPQAREALLEDKSVRFRHEMFERFCQPGKMESKACTQHETALHQAIADFVRKGGEVPVPLMMSE
jgi:hypothetical protein